MNFFIKAISVLIASLLFTACTAEITNKKHTQKYGIDRAAILERAQKSIISMQEVLNTEGIKQPTDTHLRELADLMATEMNEKPALSKKRIGVRLLKDFSFEGYEDNNDDGIRNKGEAKFFKVELDAEDNRIIYSGRSESSGYTGMAMGGGFFAGMLMQRFLNRQRKAGVRPGFFKKRVVESRSNYSNKRADFLDKQRKKKESRYSSGGSFGSGYYGRSSRSSRRSESNSRSMRTARSRSGSRSHFRGK